MWPQEGKCASGFPRGTQKAFALGILRPQTQMCCRALTGGGRAASSLPRCTVSGRRMGSGTPFHTLTDPKVKTGCMGPICLFPAPDPLIHRTMASERQNGIFPNNKIYFRLFEIMYSTSHFKCQPAEIYILAHTSKTSICLEAWGPGSLIPAAGTLREAGPHPASEPAGPVQGVRETTAVAQRPSASSGC